MIVGLANCGKTFKLKPMEQIYYAFFNPANNKYAWVGTDQTELIDIQYFRWSLELIYWKDLVHLLDGEIVKPPSLKNPSVSDACINKDLPIFATSKSKIEYVGKHNTRDERETKMMDGK